MLKINGVRFSLAQIFKTLYTFLFQLTKFDFFPGVGVIKQISELSIDAEEDNLIILVGTLYKEQELKPSVVKELSEQLHVTPQPRTTFNYCSLKDQLYLEDEMLRVRLVGESLSQKQLVTGLVCAVAGHQLGDNTFQVSNLVLVC